MDFDPLGEPIFGERTQAPLALFPRILEVTLEGQPVIEFQITDELGLPIIGLRQGENVEFSFTVSKLRAGVNGETPRWRTYIRVDDEGRNNFQAGTFSQGTLEGNGDGTYRFTFAESLADISGIGFEPRLIHRVGMEVRDAVIAGEDVPGSDAVFDLDPASGEELDSPARKIVKQESCARCHGTVDFAFHGGPRQDVDYCVTCHQPNSRDAGSGNTMDFRVMIHKIHAGEELSNKPYQFCGFGCENFGAPPQVFSDIVFPQDTRNCTTCHDPEDPDTPQADNVNNRPTAAACASCHDDLAFNEAGLTNDNDNHPGLAQPNETCAECHSEGGLIAPVLESHEIPSQVAAQRFQYNILGVSNADEGQSPKVTFSITDPTNDDAPYDIANDPAFAGDGTSVNMDIAWPTSDYTNVANDMGTDVTGTPPSRPASISLADGSGILPMYITDNGDGTFTVDTSALPTPLSVPITTPSLGSGAVVIEGHPAGDFDNDGTFSDQVPTTSAVEAFAITDAEPQQRRQVVDPAKCQNCHSQNDGLAFHGNNRTDNTQVCVACHNPNQTDLFMRPADSDGTLNGVNPEATDGLEDRTIDFKFMIHAIHGSEMREEPYVAYGFGVIPHRYEAVRYPRPVSDCLACHREGTYELPLGPNVQATTLSTNATTVGQNPGFSNPGATAFAPDIFAASDPTDDNNASPTAAVCSSCHDSELATQHMSRRSPSFISFGNAFLVNPDPIFDPDTQDRISMTAPENCAFCHGPGGFVDIEVAHGIEE